ncbi:hypothetical protein DFH09DRAFT_1379431 [Mycena vulgaris]|nr:hypothetical protein DFH09DRAFT_1379431 [Mycena vulgaris]
MFGGTSYQRIVMETMAEMPIVVEKIHEHLTPPHTLVELSLAGVHHFCAFYDTDGSMPYTHAKDVAQMMRTVKPYCVWDAILWPAPDEDEVHFIDQMIAVLEAVVPGGAACT